MNGWISEKRCRITEVPGGEDRYLLSGRPDFWDRLPIIAQNTILKAQTRIAALDGQESGTRIDNEFYGHCLYIMMTCDGMKKLDS